MKVEVLPIETGRKETSILRKEDFPPLREKTETKKAKPVVASNIMIVAPGNMTGKQQEDILRLEKEKAQMEENLRKIEKRITGLKLESSNEGSSSETPSNNTRSKEKGSEAKKKGKKAPTQTPIPRKVEEQQKAAATTAPKEAPVRGNETFAEVTRRKGKKKESMTPTTPKKRGGKVASKPPIPPPQDKAKKKKPPRTAAVTITCQDGAYEKRLREAREKINLAELSIDGMRPRRAITDGYVFEVAGENKADKANKLAARLRATIGGEGVKITRPSKTIEVRLKGLDASITPDEVREALAQKGQCDPEEIKVSVLRRISNGLNTVWARCPLVSANKIAEVSEWTGP